MIRNRTAVAALLAMAFTSSCGDRTVTSSPTSARQEAGVTTTAPAPTPPPAPAPAPGQPAGPKAIDSSVADADLAEVDRILSQVQTDLGNADREASTPEGDPTS